MFTKQNLIELRKKMIRETELDLEMGLTGRRPAGQAMAVQAAELKADAAAGNNPKWAWAHSHKLEAFAGLAGVLLVACRWLMPW